MIRAPEYVSRAVCSRGEAHRALGDNRAAYAAMSILFGIEMRDGGMPPVLPQDQADDVVKWGYRGAFA